MESNIKGLVAAGHEMASELKAECGAVDMRSVAKLISDLATQLEVQLVRANALAAENAGLKQSEKEFNNFCRQEYYGWEDNFTETPATDASLAEVRAQGVDMARNAMIDFVDGEVGPNKNVPGLIRGAEICVSIAELEAREIKPAKGEVLVVVSGFTGCGKSAIAGEIEIAMKAIGVPVKWTNGDAEKRMTGADWLTAIEMYKPTVRIVEVNVPRVAGICIKGE